MEKIIETEIATSIITIVLGILTVFVFIRSRADALFIVLIVATLVAGLLNAWLISTVDQRMGAAKTKPRGARRTRT